MSPYEFKTLAIAKFGADDWLRKISYELGTHQRVTYRWWNAEVPITDAMAVKIRKVCEL